MVVNAVGDGKRTAFNLDKVVRGEALQPRKVPIDVITDLARMNMTYFPTFPRVQQAMLKPASRRRTQDEVIQAYTEDQAVEEANRCFSCGVQRLRQLLIWSAPSRASCGLKVQRPLQDPGGLLQGCRVCIEECPTGCLEGVPELDFDTGVVRMDTAFAITQGLHGRQSEELKNLPDRPAKDIANWR